MASIRLNGHCTGPVLFSRFPFMPLTMPHSPTAGRMTGPGEKPAPRGYFPMIPAAAEYSLTEKGEISSTDKGPAKRAKDQ
ncbi:hypothetical protein B4135_0147 [Caldibacillus debilis]|uniref:Uncharacterized protein n=1 Tax=Caldibacillus debilis TaxID=301148 RepID=A0A150M4G3_9BACI|nr:hypothetical protein B4135_0147 [Caldibacillus debilis]